MTIIQDFLGLGMHEEWNPAAWEADEEEEEGNGTLRVRVTIEAV